MIIFLEEHKEFLRKLLGHKVDFILIGGYAVNYYGYGRPTGDMDIWLRPTNDNRDKLAELFLKEQFDEESIKKIFSCDFTKAQVFHFGAPPYRIDFLTFITGVLFEDAWKQKQVIPIKDFLVPVLHLDHLVLSKISNNRTKDKLDVEELQKIAGSQNKKGDS